MATSCGHSRSHTGRIRAREPEKQNGGAAAPPCDDRPGTEGLRDRGDRELRLAARRLDLHGVAAFLADEGTAHRRLVADAAGGRVGLGRAYHLVLVALPV